MKRMIVACLLVLGVAGCEDEAQPGKARETLASTEFACVEPQVQAACGSGEQASGPPQTSQALECPHTCAAKEAYSKTDVVAPSDAKVGDLTTCLVSDVVFRVQDESPRVELSGKGYYVCCERCAERFRENPARFQGS